MGVEADQEFVPERTMDLCADAGTHIPRSPVVCAACKADSYNYPLRLFANFEGLPVPLCEMCVAILARTFRQRHMTLLLSSLRAVLGLPAREQAPPLRAPKREREEA